MQFLRDQKITNAARCHVRKLIIRRTTARTDIGRTTMTGRTTTTTGRTDLRTTSIAPMFKIQPCSQYYKAKMCRPRDEYILLFQYLYLLYIYIYIYIYIYNRFVIDVKKGCLQKIFCLVLYCIVLRKNYSSTRKHALGAFGPEAD